MRQGGPTELKPIEPILEVGLNISTDVAAARLWEEVRPARYRAGSSRLGLYGSRGPAAPHAQPARGGGGAAGEAERDRVQPARRGRSFLSSDAPVWSRVVSSRSSRRAFRSTSASLSWNAS